MGFAPASDAKLATISFAKLTSSAQTERDAEISRLRTVCETIGFFYLSDHGVPLSLIHRVFKASRGFFLLPEQVKMRWGQHAQVFTPRELRGYSNGVEQVNPGVDEDNKQFFELGNERPLVPGRRFTGPNVMPGDDVAPDFARAHMEILRIAVSRLVPGLCRALALALELDEHFFSSKVTEDGMLLTQRASYYPAKSGAIGRHTDSGLFTLLLQETQLGPSSLKLFSDGEWREVVAKEELFVVNLANMLMYWTNGRFVSTPHQVVHRGEESRVSVPFFVYPDADAEIIPIGKGEDLKLISGEVYANDVEDIWKRDNGAGRWAKACERGASCGCWRCM